jgi:hypothetical protein
VSNHDHNPFTMRCRVCGAQSDWCGSYERECGNPDTKWWHPKPATKEQKAETGRLFSYTHDHLRDALDQLDALSHDWISLRSRLSAAEGERDALKDRHWTAMVHRYAKLPGSDPINGMVYTHDGEFVRHTDLLALRLETDAALARAERAEGALRKILEGEEVAARNGMVFSGEAMSRARAALGEGPRV